MTALGFALFDTALGACGAAWSARGLAGLQLPERDAEATRALMRRRFPDAPESEPPAWARAVFDKVAAMLRGEPADLSDAALDMAGIGAFEARVFDVVRAIPMGETRTYGAIAGELGQPGAAQAVGRAMARNPFAPIVPCHRVVGAGGRLVGFSAHGGTKTKLKLLAIEGAGDASQPSLFDALDRAD